MGTLRTVPRPATGKTPVRNFRIPRAIHDPATAIAAKRGETLTDVVTRALEAYIRRHRHLLEPDPGTETGQQ